MPTKKDAPLSLLLVMIHFKYPKNFETNPKIFDINQETAEKTLSDKQMIMEESGDYMIGKYETHENIKGETIRLEW